MRYNAFLAAVVMLVVVVTQSEAAAAEKFDLEQLRGATDLTRVRAQLDVSGKIKSLSEGEEKLADLSVSARLGYDERRFAWHKDGRTNLRHYDQCEVTIRVGKGRFQPRLRPSRRLVGVRVSDEEANLFSPRGALTRQELDLIDIPGNTAVLPKLLAGKKVALGASWKVSPEALAMLLGIDTVSTCDVQCVLSKVTPDRQATIELAGAVDGAIHGVATEIVLKGRLEYDLNGRRVSHVELSIKEQRARSHVGPGLDVTCKLTLNITPLRSSRHLPETAVRRGPTPDADDLRLSYKSAQGGYRFGHSRMWHVVDDQPGIVMLRLIERGELVAQCNVSPAKRLAAGKKPMTLNEYRDHVRKTLDKRFRKFVFTGKRKTKSGLWAYKLVISGESQKVAVQWVYYLLSDRSGNQVAAVFALEKKQSDQFGTAGEDLINHFHIDGPAKVAVQPKTDTRKR